MIVKMECSVGIDQRIVDDEEGRHLFGAVEARHVESLAGSLEAMSLTRRTSWTLVAAFGFALVVAIQDSPEAGGSGVVPRPELPAGDVPEVDTAVFAVG